MQRLKDTARSWLVLALVSACTPGTPRIDGSPGAPASPSTLWPVPASARAPAPDPVPPQSPEVTAALLADSARVLAERTLSLTDVLDLALQNSPATRDSWLQARSAAESYGAAKGLLYPTLTASLSSTAAGSSGNGVGFGTVIEGGFTDSTITGIGGRGFGPPRTVLTPALSLSYLIFDLGGRRGAIEAAKQRAISADLAHNTAVQNLVLQVESSLFSYLATRALRDAQIETVSEARADLEAAQERHRVGVASLQEVLQTRTALGQTQLTLETLEAGVLNARGTLAVAMGYPANLRFDVPNVEADDSVATIAASVDTLINRAMTLRPDLLAARADAAELAAQVRVARSAGYPALTLRTTSSAVEPISGTRNSGRSYALVLGLQIPIFNGFATHQNVRAARDQYLAGLARTQSTAHQISLEVFTAYNALQATTKRVHTSTSLLATAQQSADVALARYRAGVGTIIDVLLGRSQLANARAESIQARWEWRTALVQLAHDVGALDLDGHPNVPLGPRR